MAFIGLAGRVCVDPEAPVGQPTRAFQPGAGRRTLDQATRSFNTMQMIAVFQGDRRLDFADAK
jgi:hypothetical protein